MKPELIHLLSKLALDYPDFTSLLISKTGATLALRQHGAIRFETLDALEAYAWPQAEVGRDVPSAPSGNVGSSDPLAPAAQALPPVEFNPPLTSGFLQTSEPIEQS